MLLHTVASANPDLLTSFTATSHHSYCSQPPAAHTVSRCLPGFSLPFFPLQTPITTLAEPEGADAAPTGVVALGTSSHEEMAERAAAMTYEAYATLAGYITVGLLMAFATGYITYIYHGQGGPFFPMSKKPLVFTLAALLAVFPGACQFLPPGPDDGAYPSDYKFVAWYAVPQSKDDPTTKAKAFFPLCKPYNDWRESANTGKPSNTANMWSPLTLFDAMLRAPAKLLGLPAGTHPSLAKPRLLKALREAHPAIRHVLLMPAHYNALQQNVIATAFKLSRSLAIKDIIPARCKKFVPLSKLPSISVNFTDLTCAYHSYILNPTGPGVYPKMMRAISYGVDKHTDFQAHTYTASNALQMSDKITSQTRNAPAKSSGARAANPPSSPGVPSAGAAARSVVSPGRPGAPKAIRYADATRGRVVASAIASAAAPGAPPAAAPRPRAPAPYGYYRGYTPAPPGYDAPPMYDYHPHYHGHPPHEHWAQQEPEEYTEATE